MLIAIFLRANSGIAGVRGPLRRVSCLRFAKLRPRPDDESARDRRQRGGARHPGRSPCGFAASSPLLIDPILAAVIIVALLTRRMLVAWDEADVSTWRSADDVRPISTRWAASRIVRARRDLRGRHAAVLDHAAGASGRLHLQARHWVGVYAVLGLSVVVLTVGGPGVARADRSSHRGDSRRKATVDWASTPASRPDHQLLWWAVPSLPQSDSCCVKTWLHPAVATPVLVGDDVVTS
mgnify:CR=1 FL=1